MIGSSGAPQSKGDAMLAGFGWLYSLIAPFFIGIFSGIFKRIRRFVTGCGELERLLAARQHDANMSVQVMHYLRRSKRLASVRRQVLEIEAVFDVDDVARTIVTRKRIRTKHGLYRNRVYPNLHACLVDLSCNSFAASLIGTMRRTAVSWQDATHSARLFELFALCTGQPTTEQRSEEWKRLGFQGVDPQTDFRGNGVLGLENLVFFAREYHPSVVAMMASDDSPSGLSFAVVGINMTSVIADLVLSRQVAPAFFGLPPSDTAATLRVVNQLYAHVFALFPGYYAAAGPRNIMDFGPIFQRFIHTLRSRIRNGQLPDSIPCTPA